MTRGRLLIFGLDGGTWDVLDRQIEAGAMPFLARLRRTGASGVLRSTLPPLTPPAWASFQTGVNPGKHGVYDFAEYTPGSYRPSFVSSHSIRCPTIWDTLGDRGLRLIVVGVPLTYPPRPIQGRMVSGLLTPGLHSTFTHPPELARELLASVGSYRFLARQETFFRLGLRRFLDELIETEQLRFDAAEYLMQGSAWDVCMVQVQSLDNLQHAVWPALDPQHDQHAQGEAQQVSRFFRSIDERMEQLHRRAGDACHVVLLSDHGFGPLTHTVYLEEWLAAEGWFRLQDRSLRARTASWLFRAVQRLDKRELRRLLVKERRRELLSSAVRERTIDWSCCRAFVLGSALYGAVRLNVAGREAEGLIPEESATAFRGELAEHLAGLRDPDTGACPVRQVHFPEEIYRGPYIDRAPDLLVEPDKGYVFSRGMHPHHRVFEPAHYGRSVVGTHRRDGIYLLHGPQCRAIRAPTADLVDLPPTLFALLGIDIPDSFDGRPIDEVLGGECR